MPWFDVLAVVVATGGALLVLLSSVAMLRARDGLQMMNVFSPATGMGLPLIAVAGLLQHQREMMHLAP